MENRIIFREKLTELKEAADLTDGVLTKAQIREMLKTMPLEEEHFRLIYDYLAEQNIRVVESEEETGEEDENDENDENEDRRSLSLYVDELSALSDVNDEEEIKLIARVRQGDAGAKERLIEIYLPMICSMAADYGEETISSEDLIQEGNLGLLTAVDSLGESETAAACRAHIYNSIREAMEQAVTEGQESRKKDDSLVSRVNHLNEAIHNLERDLGHRVSAEEVSAYLEMPLEEIADLLRVIGDQA